MATTVVILDLCREMLNFTRKSIVYGHSKNFPCFGLRREDVDPLLLLSTVSSMHYSAKTVKDVVISFVAVGYYLGELALVLDQQNALYSFKKGSDMVELGPLWDFEHIYEHSKDLAKGRLNAPANEPYVQLLNTINNTISLVPKEYMPIFLSCMHKGQVSFAIEITEQNPVKNCAEEINLLMKKINKK